MCIEGWVALILLYMYVRATTTYTLHKDSAKPYGNLNTHPHHLLHLLPFRGLLLLTFEPNFKSLFPVRQYLQVFVTI